MLASGMIRGKTIMGNWFLLTTEAIIMSQEQETQTKSDTITQWVNLDQASLVKIGADGDVIGILMSMGADSAMLRVSEPSQVQRVLRWLESQQSQ
jgi:hypothetical protein